MKLTLDIGGSKTSGFLYAGGEPEKIEIRGGFGKAEDSECIDSEFFSILKTLLGDRAQAITAVAVNLGGKNKREILQTVSKICDNAKVRIHRESEGVLASRIMQSYNVNILIMAGTGCIVFARSKRGYKVLGGWGKEYGDDGSGYSVGIKAVRYSLKDLDSGAEKTALLTQTLFGVKKAFCFQAIEEYAEARDAAREKIPKTREGVAALTKVVVACAERGCPLSKRILNETGEELADLVLTATKAEALQRLSIVVNGGVTSFYKHWQSAFLEKLKQAGETATVICLNDGIDKALKQMVEEM